jgi:hypothetical protein
MLYVSCIFTKDFQFPEASCLKGENPAFLTRILNFPFLGSTLAADPKNFLKLTDFRWAAVRYRSKLKSNLSFNMLASLETCHVEGIIFTF